MAKKSIRHVWSAFMLVSCVFLRSAVADVAMPAAFPGKWVTIGRALLTAHAESVTIANGSVANMAPFGDGEFTFRARMPANADQVQIWGAVRVKDDLHRYVVGLRGGREPEVSFARYSPDATAKFLGFAPLDVGPTPGHWYTVRVVAVGQRFHVYLNDEVLPRINVEDRTAFWTEGGVAVGGGWLPTEFRDVKFGPLTDAALTAFNSVKDQVWAPPSVDKDAVRRSQRAAYVPIRIEQLPPVRGEISLDGNWLFMPDQDLGDATLPQAAAGLSDQDWHVIAVPSFWTPFLGWLHGESGGLADLQGLSAARGPSDALVVGERTRVDAQTFDWRRTKSGWYRQHLDLPAGVSGRQVHLVFDAVAKITEVFLNGQKVGSNIGMFGQIDCDVSRVIQPGQNVIAVHVVGQPIARVPDADKVQGTAVSVQVTNAMLRSLPHGMAPDDSSGIWQPVRLVVTNPVRVGDVFVQPRLDGATADVELANGDAQPRTIRLSYSIEGAKDHKTLLADTPAQSVTIPGDSSVTVKITTPELQPKLWSPQTPNLYTLNLKLAEGGATVDQKPIRFGFRTFTISGERFLLNGKPYWLRGGNHFPATLRPNDAALAHRFIQLAREGNVEVTRSHAIPFTQTWLDAADEEGMGVSFEGTWPWLMLQGEPPSSDLLKVWHDEFASLLRTNRNHPSILFWTVNNEMNFANFDRNNLPLMKRKWEVLDNMIRTMRQVDATRPISAYSGYHRSDTQTSLTDVVIPNQFDDGDIDDVHRYNGWYNPTFFHL
ncbi:MAG: glycosyl hydrolase family 2, partial [Phycisphaerales bacterium]|nr:glycosyl hydrolase family 2 [Phycisphaerales bacterium]